MVVRVKFESEWNSIYHYFQMINALLTWIKCKSGGVSHSSVVRASNRYLEGHGFDSRWGLKNSFSEYFDLRTLLHYLPLFSFCDVCSADCRSICWAR